MRVRRVQGAPPRGVRGGQRAPSQRPRAGRAVGVRRPRRRQRRPPRRRRRRSGRARGGRGVSGVARAREQLVGGRDGASEPVRGRVARAAPAVASEPRVGAARARAQAPGGAVRQEGVHAVARGGAEARRGDRVRGHPDGHDRDGEDAPERRRGVRGGAQSVAAAQRALLVARARADEAVARAGVPRAVRLRGAERGDAADEPERVARRRHAGPGRRTAGPESDGGGGRGGGRRRARHALEHRAVFAGEPPGTLRGARRRVRVQAVEARARRRARGRRGGGGVPGGVARTGRSGGNDPRRRARGRG